MGQAHRDLVDSRQATERLFYCPCAEGTVKAADACANFPAVWPSRWFFTPWSESRGGSCRDIHGFLPTVSELDRKFSGCFRLRLRGPLPETLVVESRPQVGLP